MSTTQFIKSFINRKGGHILFSFLFIKVVNFVVALVVVRLLTKAEYGFIAYAVTIISFVVPFMGAGVHQGFLRYGSICGSQIGKRDLFRRTIKKGLLFSAIIAVLIILLIPFITSYLAGSALFLGILTFQLIALLLLQFVGIYCRLLHLNKLFAQIEISNSALLFVGNIGMALCFGGVGYVLSLSLVPFIVACFYIYKLRLYKSSGEKSRATLPIGKFIKYGMSMSAGGVLSQLLFGVDIITIGYILQNEELVAQYKVASIIPFSFLMIPGAIIATDFVKLSAASKTDKPFLKTYYLNFLKLFSIFSVALFFFFFFFGESLLSIFGKNYQQTPELMCIFAFGIIGGMMFRVPLGNMLSVIGWPNTNAIFSLIVLIINLVANYYMVTWYGVIGAAITTSVLMWFSGLLSLGAFVWFLRE